MTYRKIWVHLTLLAALGLSLGLAPPAHAHGGIGDHLHGPAARWMIELIYLQLLMIPVVGIWLTREAIAAWWPRRRVKEMGV